MENLKNLKVAVLVADGFELSEFVEPVKALEQEGATVHVVSTQKDTVRSWDNGNWGKEFAVDVELENANPNDFDALLLPGGVINPDKLRRSEKAVDFVKTFMKEGKPLAAICHGPWTLIETGMVKGRKLTSFYSIKTDLINAGADWQDKEVVVDQNLVTSRNPGDIPAFISKMTEKFKEGVHEPHSK
ncbi:MAG: type 1 glutamine amidotransferase [Bacteroidetes bacterium]|nr:type 1 glutamine amidotransferase [Bacteroidota bacterium]HET6243001.1 type 1 glutamine amidotransferase domain-containing protein [Bacteroidia bacterium]